jgi:hypothetical protein
MTALPSSRQVRAAAGAAFVSPDSPPGIRHGAESSAEAPRTDTPSRGRTLGESLREARLRHRRDRLQLVISDLDERLRSPANATERDAWAPRCMDVSGAHQRQRRVAHPPLISRAPVPGATRAESGDEPRQRLPHSTTAGPARESADTPSPRLLRAAPDPNQTMCCARCGISSIQPHATRPSTAPRLLPPATRRFPSSRGTDERLLGLTQRRSPTGPLVRRFRVWASSP